MRGGGCGAEAAAPEPGVELPAQALTPLAGQPQTNHMLSLGFSFPHKMMDCDKVRHSRILRVLALLGTWDKSREGTDSKILRTRTRDLEKRENP